MDLEERIAHLEYKLELLFENTEISRYLYECDITKAETNEIMDLFECISNSLMNGVSVSHVEYESAMYDIIPRKNGDYHFCELLARLFSENGQWEEVFYALYGDMLKYKSLVNE